MSKVACKSEIHLYDDLNVHNDRIAITPYSTQSRSPTS